MKRESTDRREPERPAKSDEIEIVEVVGLDEVPDGDGPKVSDDEVEIVFEPDAPDEPVTGTPATGHVPPRGGFAEPDTDGEHERFLRLRADFENLKKRVEREKEEYVQKATSGLVMRLLVVVDNFERALLATETPGSDPGFREGVTLIHRQLLDELQKEGLVPIDAVGTSFDPARHEAVATDPSGEYPTNTVVEEFQRGYYFQGTLLRPSHVRVAVEPGPEPDGIESTES